jgi:quercetin dioxygenase-like cupin family protein
VPRALEGRSRGLKRWTIVGEDAGAVHTGFGISEMDGGGSVDAHVHAYEETVYVLEGELVLETMGRAFAMLPGDYGLIPVSVAHALRNRGSEGTRFVAMSSPQPRDRFGGDTFFVPKLAAAEPIAVDVRDPRTRSFGHLDPEAMEVEQQTQERMKVSASMRTALLVYSGITVKMMIDRDLGAELQTMFMVQYRPGGFAGAHDHPFEETYLILEGETDAAFDGEPYHLERGDVAWAGVGCVHEFSNSGPGNVRWLETQAPQPPPRHSYRFARDWNYLREAIGEEG